MSDKAKEKFKRPLSFEETILAMANLVIEKHDPVEKAKRSKRTIVHVNKVSPKRTPIPMATQHQVNLRDKGLCRFILPTGGTCHSSRFTETHHIKLLSQGGTHNLENLITLCGAHHKHVHETKERSLR
jgi:5-methylcytosine-specific restriction endonuclease McrA